MTEAKNNLSEAIHINEVVGQLPLKSGVGFRVEYNDLSLHMPLRPVTQTDDELIHWFEKEFNTSFAKKSHLYKDYSAYRDDVLAVAPLEKAMEFTGGLGITSRTMDTLEKDSPGLSELIKNTSGKKVFIGNGLSTAPLSLDTQSIIADMFDYKLLLSDLEQIAIEFKRNRIKPPNRFEAFLSAAMQINTAITNQSIQAINYYFGSGNPPVEILNADLVINSHGPPLKTFEEQLSLLKIGGVLVNPTARLLPPPNNTYSKKVLPNTNTEVFYRER